MTRMVLMAAAFLAAAAGFAADGGGKDARAAEEAALWKSMMHEFRSSLDGTMQRTYLYVPAKAKTDPVPLVVGLHTWSYDITAFASYGAAYSQAKKHDWIFVGPDFRGPNKTPQGCGSDLAVQDIVDAIAFAKTQGKVDAGRIYITGGSGGGMMTLLMLGRHPEIFAAGAAFCPITDLALWHAQSLEKHPGRGAGYAKHMECACGGKPDTCRDEYVRRSPITYLKALRGKDVKTYIATGIHDGWTGSVPVGQAIRAFNALADDSAAVSEADIAAIEAEQKIPPGLANESGTDPFYSEKCRVHFRRTSANARITLFEGGHGGNFPAGFDFLARQRKGTPVDWTIPATGKASVSGIAR